MRQDMLIKVLKTFGRTFVTSLIVLIPGVWVAPNFTAGKALAVGAVLSSVAAGVRAVEHLLFETP